MCGSALLSGGAFDDDDEGDDADEDEDDDDDYYDEAEQAAADLWGFGLDCDCEKCMAARARMEKSLANNRAPQ